MPEFYSVPTVWAFSMLEAISLLPNSGISPGYGRLYFKCIFWHYHYIEEIKSSINEYRKIYGVWKLSRSLALGFFGESVWICSKIRSRYVRRKNRRYVSIYKNVPGAKEALLRLKYVVNAMGPLCLPSVSKYK